MSRLRPGLEAYLKAKQEEGGRSQEVFPFRNRSQLEAMQRLQLHEKPVIFH